MKKYLKSFYDAGTIVFHCIILYSLYSGHRSKKEGLNAFQCNSFQEKKWDKKANRGPCKSLILPVSQDFVSAANAMATYKVTQSYWTIHILRKQFQGKGGLENCTFCLQSVLKICFFKGDRRGDSYVRIYVIFGWSKDVTEERKKAIWLYHSGLSSIGIMVDF